MNLLNQRKCFCPHSKLFKRALWVYNRNMFKMTFRTLKQTNINIFNGPWLHSSVCHMTRLSRWFLQQFEVIAKSGCHVVPGYKAFFVGTNFVRTTIGESKTFQSTHIFHVLYVLLLLLLRASQCLSIRARSMTFFLCFSVFLFLSKTATQSEKLLETRENLSWKAVNVI